MYVLLYIEPSASTIILQFIGMLVILGIPLLIVIAFFLIIKKRRK